MATFPLALLFSTVSLATPNRDTCNRGSVADQPSSALQLKLWTRVQIRSVISDDIAKTLVSTKPTALLF